MDALKRTLREEMERAEKMIDDKRQETQELVLELHREREELEADRQRLEAERAAFAESKAALEEELEEVSRLRVQLEDQKASSTVAAAKPQGFWACCMCPTTDKHAELVHNHKPVVESHNNGFHAHENGYAVQDDPTATHPALHEHSQLDDPLATHPVVHEHPQSDDPMATRLDLHE